MGVSESLWGETTSAELHGEAVDVPLPRSLAQEMLFWSARNRVLWISRELLRDKISPRQGYRHPAHGKICQEFSGPGRLLPTFCQEFSGHCRSPDLLAQKEREVVLAGAP